MPCQIVIGGFDLKALAEIGVWRKLLLAVSPDIPIITAIFLTTSSEESLKLMREVIPRSLWERTVVGENRDEWYQALAPDLDTRSFGCLIKEGIADPLMVGLPTEDALDRFEESLGRRINCS